jgi:hypothetical protein
MTIIIISVACVLIVANALFIVRRFVGRRPRAPAPRVDWYALSFGANGKVLPKDAP